MNEQVLAAIGRWSVLQTQLAAIKEEEMKLRQEIFATAFADPLEGSNTIDLPEGWKLKGTYKLTRTLDEAALPAVIAALRKKKVNVDLLIQYKPSLCIKPYRTLPEEQRLILDQALTTKPGAPALELIAPKS